MTKEESLQKRELERKREDQRLTNAYQRVFHTEDGKRVLEDLRTLFRLEGRVFTPVRQGDHHGYDPLTAALADGARSVLIYLQKRLSAKSQGDANIETTTEKIIKP